MSLMSLLILSIIYFVIVLPIGLLARLFAGNIMGYLKSKDSYWIELDKKDYKELTALTIGAPVGDKGSAVMIAKDKILFIVSMNKSHKLASGDEVMKFQSVTTYILECMDDILNDLRTLYKITDKTF